MIFEVKNFWKKGDVKNNFIETFKGEILIDKRKMFINCGTINVFNCCPTLSFVSNFTSAG